MQKIEVKFMYDSTRFGVQKAAAVSEGTRDSRKTERVARCGPRPARGRILQREVRLGARKCDLAILRSLV